MGEGAREGRGVECLCARVSACPGRVPAGASGRPKSPAVRGGQGRS